MPGLCDVCILATVLYPAALRVIALHKKALRETQTLCAGCNKVEPKFLPRRRPPSQGHRTAKI